MTREEFLALMFTHMISADGELAFKVAQVAADYEREQCARLVEEMVEKNYELDDFANSVRAGAMRLCTDGRPKWLKDEMEAAKIERLRLDSERYQWLKQSWTTTLLDGSIQMASSHGIRCKSVSEIDAAIDAAIAKAIRARGEV